MDSELDNLTLAKHCCILASLIDEDFYNHNETLVHGVMKFNSYLNDGNIDSIINYFSNFSIDDLKTCYKHISNDDLLRLNQEIQSEYYLVMNGLNNIKNNSLSNNHEFVL